MFFFALEIVQNALSPIEIPEQNLSKGEEDEDDGESVATTSVVPQNSYAQSINISAILLSAVISDLVSKVFLGNELALSVSESGLKNPLLELPLYLLLGVLSGFLAALFSGAAQVAKSVFEGTSGPEGAQDFFSSLPYWSKPVIGSLICGALGVAFPQTLFFGYETLNGLLAAKDYPTTDLFVLLGAKFTATTIATASGLVGGTFAPSIFLGGMLGAGFHNIVFDVWQAVNYGVPQISALGFELSDMPAYSLVGGASVLAALFRAPLTASLLLFECTQNYDVLLPLMASAGVASLVGDLVEQALEEQRRDQDSVSWGDLAMRKKKSDEECAVDSEQS